MNHEDFTLTHDSDLRIQTSRQGFIRAIEILDIGAYTTGVFSSRTHILLKWTGLGTRGHNGSITPVPVIMNAAQDRFENRFNPPLNVYRNESKKLSDTSTPLSFKILEADKSDLVVNEYVIRLRVWYADNTFYPHTVYDERYVQKSQFA